ncbi:TetR family transcriptional regulator [Desertihabitans aurantiacus]|uniref:TetR family transcriptional regulator n=1 Tax=Desertihabitans aurantiacus TaxID=2282477 RepID=UPI000DF807CA|nr:TetR family transcriptional regulator [Desertihabitans aurantiacus]
MSSTRFPQRRRTSAGEERRRQIVEATIRLLARHGPAGTAFTSIASEAALSSPGLISYHFTDKTDLMSQVVEHILTSLGSSLAARVAEAGDDPVARLRAYLAELVRYQDTHRDEVAAVWRLLATGAAEALTGRGRTTALPPTLLTEILRDGQRRGAFRPFDVDVMAQALHCSAEGYRERFLTDDHADADAFTAELTELFIRATAP